MSNFVERLSNKSKLIDCVKQNPMLWQVLKRPRGLKEKLWNEVGKEVGTSGSDARRQWEILRDQFRRELKRHRSDKNFRSRWLYYDQMFFIRNTLRVCDGQTVMSKTDDQQSQLDISQGVEQNFDAQMELANQVHQDLYSSDLMEPSGEASTSAGVSSSSITRQVQEEDGGLSSEQRRRRRRWRTESTDDEDYHFVMSILPSLRRIQETTKLRVRSKIMDVIATELESGREEDTRSEESGFRVKEEPENSDEEKRLVVNKI